MITNEYPSTFKHRGYILDSYMRFDHTNQRCILTVTDRATRKTTSGYFIPERESRDHAQIRIAHCMLGLKDSI